MKIGELDIKKAYFGAKEITPSNAYLGDVPIKKDEGIPNDEIWYTTLDGNIVIPETNALPIIVSNTYSDDKGVIKFISDVTNIGSGAFVNNHNLSSIIIPKSVINIEDHVFYDCLKLSSIIIPNNIINIGMECFADCRSLTSISYIGTMAQWNTITKEEDWHTGVPATVVHCSDGDAPL